MEKLVNIGYKMPLYHSKKNVHSSHFYGYLSFNSISNLKIEGIIS